MGFLNSSDDDNNNEQDEGNRLLDQQLKTNQAELEAKKQSLFQTRLDIIKGQGAEDWGKGQKPSGTLIGKQINNGLPNGSTVPFTGSKRVV
jgi:hypothetical protein